MRVVHPLWRGFFLAAALAAIRVLLGPVDAVFPYLLDRRLLAFCGALLAGAFLASLPGRFRHGWKMEKPTWQRAVICLCCGAAMMLAYRLAGGAWLSALMEGSAGAYAFAGMALAAGFITVRVMNAAERRRRA